MKTATFQDQILKIGAVQRVMRWLDAMPRPAVAIDISSDRISAVRWSRAGDVEKFATETLAAGMIVPSAVEPNIVDSAGVRSAMARACSSIQATGEHAALLLPDPVIRIFVQHFDEFPRAPQEAIPLLRWRLKKSVPFEMTDAVLSYVRQESREGGLDIVTTIARLARISDRSLTTAIIRDGALCGYRCTELPVSAADLTPQALLDEIYPFAAYFHDAWHERIESVCISGIGKRFPAFAAPIESELQCKVQQLLRTKPADTRISESGRRLAEAGLDGLVGWMLSRD